jgi:pre-peptidase
MKRVTRRSMALVLAGVAACKGDPTGDLRNGVDHLVATPSAIFLSPGASTNVLIEAVDEQGNREGTRFSLGVVSPEINVVIDSGFNQVVDNNGNFVLPDEPTRLRYIVTPEAPVGDASFEVKAGGHSITIPVRLVPDSVAATFSNAAPALGDTVTLTTAAPFVFGPAATVTAGGSDAIMVSHSATTLKFVPFPGGAAGPVTVNGVGLTYASTLSLSLPSTASFTVPAGLTGTGSLATAPAFTIPAAGSTKLFIDEGITAAVPQCTNSALGSPCRVYKITLAAGRSFDMTATWGGEQDMGIYFLNSAGTLTFTPGACDDKGDGAAGQPESCTITLAAGTFYMVAVNFSGDDPTWLRLDLEGK